MERNTKLEIGGFGLMLVGGLLWLSKTFYFIEALTSVYSWMDIILPVGLLIWALGYMQKESIQKKIRDNDKKES